MKISELQKRAADVLGVSISQKELSFDIFIESISEILDHGITLKVPRVGFFQLKQNSSKNEQRKILFSPLPEDYSQDMRNLYLTIDITSKQKNALEFDSHVFSIGVGKPLLPLTSDELPDSETSYAMLKKSIEERVRELISESDQIPNFNIWDDYYKSLDEFEQKTYNDTQTRINDLTSDLDYKEITVQHNIHPGFFEDYLSSKDSAQAPTENKISDKLPQDETKDKTEEKDEDNYWPNINEEQIIDFDNIHSRIDEKINESENLESIVSNDEKQVVINDEKQEESIEQNIDEDGIDYSEIEAGSIDEDKDSSQTLAHLLNDVPLEEQIPKEETNLAEDNIPTDLMQTTEQTDVAEKTLTEEELETTDQSDPGIVYDETKKNEELLEEEESIITEENQGAIDKFDTEVNSDEPEKVEELTEEVGEIITEENSEFVDKHDAEINPYILEKVEELMIEEGKTIEEKPEFADEANSNINSIEPEMVEQPNAEGELTNMENIEKANGEEKPGEQNKIEEADAVEKPGEQGKTETAETNETTDGPEKTDATDEGYKFAELEKLIEDEKAETIFDDTGEGKSLTNKKNIFGDETSSDDNALQKTGERIEWNWGDELREEFGLTKELQEDQNVEHTSDYDNINDDLKLIDEPIESDRRFTKDLFKELEKTLERDKLFDDIPTRKRPTIVEFPNENDRAKKIFLEFSAPPTRYEFIEDRRVEREKRMAISLIEEDDRHFVSGIVKEPTLEKQNDEKEKYFGRTFLIIISTFVIVIATIIVFVLRPNNKDVQQAAPGISQQKETNEIQGSQTDKNSVSQTQTKTEAGSQQKSVSTSPINDELSDFPISAVPPVPIKTGAVEKKVEKNSAVSKDSKQPAIKQAPTGTNAVTKSEPNETRIGNSIYTDGKTFNYQTSSWKNKQKAEQEIKRLHGLGLNAYMLEVYLPQKGGTWYRVRVGSFKTQKEAENSMKQNNF